MSEGVNTVDSVKKFSEGVVIKGKLFGVEDVKKETGDDICQDAMIKLKAIIAVKKEHKQKLNIKVDLDGIELMDENMTSLYRHSVNRIAYIARDLKDPRAIGYIYKNIDNNCQYFGLRTERQAQELFNLLKDLFECVLELRTKTKNNDEASKESKEVDEKPLEAHQPPVETESDKAPLIRVSESESEKVELKTQESTNSTPSPVSTEPAVESKPTQETSLFDLSSEPVSQPAKTPGMDDLFGLGDLSLESPASPQPVASGMSNDLFSMFNTPSLTPTNPTVHNPTMNFNNQFQGVNGMSPNMTPQFTPAYPMNSNNMNQMPQMPHMQPFNQSVQTPRAAPLAPTPTTSTPPSTKVQTNAFDDLFN